MQDQPSFPTPLSPPHPTTFIPCSGRSMGIILKSAELDHLRKIGTNEGSKSRQEEDEPPKAEGPLAIAAGLPPVPQRLVARIQAGEFIDMAELLPDRLGVSAGPSLDGDKEERQGQKPKQRQVTNILEWVQCFGIYMSVLTKKAPDRIQDLLGYQGLILEARMEYAGDGWLGYDRRFRQRAAANPDAVWARIDPTLWNIAFAGQGRASRCRFCFSLSHHSEDCDWAPSPTKNPPQEASSGKPFSAPSRFRGASSTGSPVCYEWNFSPDPVCPHPGCKYRHICIYCSNDARVADKEHKAVHCSRRRRPPPWQMNTGPTRQTNYGNRYQPY